VQREPENTNTLPVVGVGDIVDEESSGNWLIENLWGARAVGIVCGNPKVGKSWLGLDMAVSVASGTDCLGRFSVVEPGPALIYLAEDPLPALKERVRSIGRARGVALESMQLEVVTASRLRLDHREDRARLTETVRRHRPRLLLLDPLVRLHGVNENDAREISELLSFLRDLQRQFEVAIVLVHHARKGGSQVGGQALRGSGDLWAFGDSNLYLRRVDGKLSLSIEHRLAAAPEPVALKLLDDDPDRVHLEVVGAHVQRQRDELDLANRVIETLEHEPALSRTKLRERLRVKNERLGEMLTELERDGRLERGPAGWSVVWQPKY
jgi:hypothetical protein